MCGYFYKVGVVSLVGLCYSLGELDGMVYIFCEVFVVCWCIVSLVYGVFINGGEECIVEWMWFNIGNFVNKFINKWCYYGCVFGVIYW